jgi:hypothetical protein
LNEKLRKIAERVLVTPSHAIDQAGKIANLPRRVQRYPHVRGLTIYEVFREFIIIDRNIYAER